MNSSRPPRPAPRLGRRVDALREWLPKGARLPAADWNARHRLLMAVAWANLALLVAVGMGVGLGAGHVALETATIALFLAWVHVVRSRGGKAILVGLALVTCSAVLVHFTGGLIESHFHFFVVVPLISLYRDWRPLAVGLAYVILHHSVAGAIDPASVFNHPAALANPVLWALIHSLYVMGLTLVIIAYWRFSERLEGALAQEESLRREAETQSHEMERERLQTLVRSKDEFVASVSHELRTPLAAVMGFAEVLRDGHSELSAEDQRELLATIAREAYDLTGIVEDLLVAARAEMDTVHIGRVEVDIGANCAQVLEVLPAEDRDRIAVARPRRPVRAVADPVRVRQIIRNLLTNAIRYGGPQVAVDYRTEAGRIYLWISDDGEEIPPAQRERIFQPYSVAHEPGSQPSAVGLGLAVSRQLAEMMDGRLTYRHEGGRSVFELQLPAAPPDHRTGIGHTELAVTVAG